MIERFGDGTQCLLAAMDSQGESPFLPRIYTVGHSNHDIEPFFKLLSRHRVEALVDVRSIPSSGRFPQFKKRSLERLCASRGIGYRHCPELGNKGVDGGIAALLRKPEGRAALDELAASARKATPCGGATAFMCAEADWQDCHRQVIAQKLLEDYNIVTTHIARDGMAEPHPRGHVLPSHYGIVAAREAASPLAQGACECCPPDGADDDLAVGLALSLQRSSLGSLQTGQLTAASGGYPDMPAAEPSQEATPSEPTRVRRWGKKR
eukprot:TRINITY_DN84207_c0_g1_i1.p1 TRINITY_DN84207_c0_g1~~TRINITY_DN84207_c0_g1_i1.p1  ORF type:complete len:265 (-),score=49.82 TRINITY_DN84207_c0_g1_i1:53-847(-)